METVLVTGSSGFIGGQVVSHLLNLSKSRVVGFDLLPSKHQSENYSEHQNHDDHSINELFEKITPSYVIHCAAQADVTRSMTSPSLDATSNIVLTIKLLENLNANTCKKFIYLNSGGATYDPYCPLPFSESSKEGPESFYGLSKLVGERYVRMFCENSGIPWSSLALSNVYGPVRSTNKGIVSVIYNKLLTAEPITLFGPETTRDYIHVQDVVAAIFSAMESSNSGRFNISTKVETTLMEIYRLISEIMNVESVPIIQSKRPGEVSRSFLDNSKAKELLGWKPEYSLWDGLNHALRN